MWSGFPGGVKLSTEDWEPEGIRIEETIEVAKALEREGVSHLNMMGGTHATAAREFLLPNAFNAVHTRMIKEAVHIPVFIGHNIFTPEEAEAMLAEGNGDFVALGRSQLADPAWAQKSTVWKGGRYQTLHQLHDWLYRQGNAGAYSHSLYRKSHSLQI